MKAHKTPARLSCALPQNQSTEFYTYERAAKMPMTEQQKKPAEHPKKSPKKSPKKRHRFSENGGSKPSSVLMVACSQVSTVAPELAAPSTVVAKEAVVEPHDGGSLEKAGEAMAVVAAEEETVGGLTTKKRWLHCATCAAPLKPPIFEVCLLPAFETD